MGASWLRFAVVWVVILAVVWWASTMTIRYELKHNGGSIGPYGQPSPTYQVVAIESPAAPSREEIIKRGALGTFVAVLGWLWIRAAVRLDRDRNRERHRSASDQDAA